MKTKLMALLAAIAMSLGAWAEPTVTDITAKQRYPWNGLVDISCNVSGIDETAYNFVLCVVDKDSNKEYAASHFSVEHGLFDDVPDVDAYEDGTYKLLWDARTDLGQVVVERMVARVTLEAVSEDEDVGAVRKVQLWEGGPYWADRNIGASKPWNYGLYFRWGEATGRRSGSRNLGDAIANESVSELQSAGWLTSDGILTPNHDAAHVMWGGKWRMPTRQEMSDLCSKCKWIWTTENGVKGFFVVGRGSYGSNYIFLPTSGTLGFYLEKNGVHGRYWSSVKTSDSRIPWGLYFHLHNQTVERSAGAGCAFPIRPVQ